MSRVVRHTNIDLILERVPLALSLLLLVSQLNVVLSDVFKGALTRHLDISALANVYIAILLFHWQRMEATLIGLSLGWVDALLSFEWEAMQIDKTGKG